MPKQVSFSNYFRIFLEMEQLMDEMVQLKNATEINSTLLENIEYLLQVYYIV